MDIIVIQSQEDIYELVNSFQRLNFSVKSQELNNCLQQIILRHQKSMGNYQGVIWNDSDFTIQYVVYGLHESIPGQSLNTIPQQFAVKMNQNVIQGFRRSAPQIIQKSSLSFIEVLPGYLSTQGLNHIELQKQKISVRIRIKDYVKYLLKDVVIRSTEDMCLKIRYDGSIKNMSKKQATQLIKQLKIKEQQMI